MYKVQILISLEIGRGNEVLDFRRWLWRRLMHLSIYMLVCRESISKLANYLLFISIVKYQISLFLSLSLCLSVSLSLSLYIYIYIYIYRPIRIMVRVFANGPGDCTSILGRVIPKTQKMVLDESLLDTPHDKVWIKSKVEQSRGKICIFTYTSVL